MRLLLFRAEINTYFYPEASYHFYTADGRIQYITRDVVQLVERTAGGREVEGSSLSVPTRKQHI